MRGGFVGGGGGGGGEATVQASRRQMFPVAIERLCPKLSLKWLAMIIYIREVQS